MGKFDNNENLIDKIKSIDPENLQSVADSIRDELINDVSLSGGHLASNLGVVELTIALHKVFDSPKDKIIFDVGHQCYVHKILTGRRKELKKIRKFNCISGFPKRSESIHDMYDSGHSGTSISAALGYAKARDLNKEKYSCIAVIGDGALTSGVAYEALNDAGDSKTPLIIVLNDNQMSISGSVGGMKKNLNKLRTSPEYLNFKSKIKNSTENIPSLYKSLERARDAVKSLFVPGSIFEEMGIKYYGPIDGHNIPDLCDAFEFAKAQDRPILLHVITKKGKGYKFAEEDPATYHGVSDFDINKKVDGNVNQHSYSYIFGDELLNLARQDENIVAISAAMIGPTGLGKMKKEIPDRVFDVGIAEQHAVSFAAGMALNGKKSVVAIYSTFLQRAYDEILTEVCLQNLPVVFAIDRAGVSGSDGETHQGNFDISYLQSMPNMTILSPYDEGSFRYLLKYALSLNKPVAIRYPKGNSRASEKPLEYLPGPKCFLDDGNNAVILTDSAFVENAVVAARMLNKGISVFNMEVLKPINTFFLDKIVDNTDFIITIEDGSTIGGFGSEIAKYAVQKGKARVLCLGWPDRFIEHGSISELREKYELDVKGIAKKVGDFIENQT